MDWKDRWWCSAMGHKSDQPWLGYLESEVETSTEKHLPSYYILKKQIQNENTDVYNHKNITNFSWVIEGWHYQA